MDGDLKWVIGIAVSMVVSFGGIMITTFRNMSAKIAETHDRIDDVKEKYVRRDDLDGCIMRIDQNIRDLRDEMHANHKEIIRALSSRQD